MCNRLGSKGLCKFFNFGKFPDLTKEEYLERAKSYRIARNCRNNIKGEYAFTMHWINEQFNRRMWVTKKVSVIKRIKRMEKINGYYSGGK